MYKLFSFFLLLPFLSLGQKPHPQKHLQVYIGRSFNGTGDIRGFAYKTEYGQYFKNKYSWYINMGGTIHDDAEPIFYTDQSGNQIDASVRETTAGFQVSGLIGFSFVRNDKHEAILKIGSLFRYQSTSYNDILGIFPPAGTGLNFPVVSFINKSPQRTASLGGNLELIYNFILSKNITIGILVELQIDTNGDTLRQTLFSIGKRF